MTNNAPKFTLHHGDCKTVMATFEPESIGSIVTDPPYGLSKDPDIEEVLKQWEARTSYEHGGTGFMGKAWDSFVPNPDVWDEAYRVLKPGGYLLAFAGTRTQGLMATSIEMADFKIMSQLSWVFGSGFPKSLNVGKAVESLSPKDAKKWDGWSTALKPAYEPIIVAAKPFDDGTYPTAHIDWDPFTYTSKTSRKERNEGITVGTNTHPTVKPKAIMKWLISLEGIEGPVLDPFAGSGSTGVGCGECGVDFVGIELTEEYIPIIDMRVRLAYTRAIEQEQQALVANPWNF